MGFLGTQPRGPYQEWYGRTEFGAIETMNPGKIGNPEYVGKALASLRDKGPKTALSWAATGPINCYTRREVENLSGSWVDFGYRTKVESHQLIKDFA